MWQHAPRGSRPELAQTVAIISLIRHGAWNTRWKFYVHVACASKENHFFSAHPRRPWRRRARRPRPARRQRPGRPRPARLQQAAQIPALLVNSLASGTMAQRSRTKQKSKFSLDEPVPVLGPADHLGCRKQWQQQPAGRAPTCVALLLHAPLGSLAQRDAPRLLPRLAAPEGCGRSRVYADWWFGCPQLSKATPAQTSDPQQFPTRSSSTPLKPWRPPLDCRLAQGAA